MPYPPYPLISPLYPSWGSLHCNPNDIHPTSMMDCWTRIRPMSLTFHSCWAWQIGHYSPLIESWQCRWWSVHLLHHAHWHSSHPNTPFQWWNGPRHWQWPRLIAAIRNNGDVVLANATFPLGAAAKTKSHMVNGGIHSGSVKRSVKLHRNIDGIILG